MKRMMPVLLVLLGIASLASGEEDKEYEAWKRSQEANLKKQGDSFRRTMQSRIDELIRVCNLDAAQQKRFELASKGAVERCLEAHRDFQEKQWLRRKNGNRGAFPRLEKKDQYPSLQSVWTNAIARDLNPDQKKIYASETQARIEYYAEKYVREIVQQIDYQHRLSARQREVLTKTIRESIAMPTEEAENASNTAAVAIYKGLANVPDEPIRRVLSQDQFQGWKEMKKRYERSYKNH